MRLEELIPEKLIWSWGSVALVLAAALFAYEMLRPEVSAHASGLTRQYPTVEAAHVSGFGKDSPFAQNEQGAILVKLPQLAAKYQKKVFYVWRPTHRGR